MILNLITIFVLTFSLILFIKYSKKFNIDDVNQIQNIHEENISRLGGLGLIISLTIYLIFKQDLILLKIILISTMALLPAILEDFRVFVKPLIRLTLILFSSFLIVTSIENLPQLDFPIFHDFFNNYYFKIIFFSMCLTVLVNGQNIIDGTNGLSALTSITIFGCLLFLGLIKDDQYLISISFIFILLLSCFLFFNYPFGKIFLGDSGSYFLGFISGYLILKTYGNYKDLSTWSAAVILFYPCLEVVFSYLRKIFQGKSPFMPDNKHLHLKVYYLLQGGQKKSVLYNALVAPFLAIIWLTPLVVLPFIIEIPKLSFMSIMGIVIVYLFFYYSIPEPKNKN